jgi:metal-sulfur cluster biosynthetic enzyme
VTAGSAGDSPAAPLGPLELMPALGGQISPDMLRDLLGEVIDPEIGINIVDLGLVYGIRLSGDGVASIEMTLTTPGCPLGAYIEDSIRERLWGAPGVTDVDVRIVWDPPWDPDQMMTGWAKQQLGWRQ